MRSGRSTAAIRNALHAAISATVSPRSNAAKDHEADGASSIATWARRELRQDAGLTRQMVRAAVDVP